MGPAALLSTRDNCIDPSHLPLDSYEITCHSSNVHIQLIDSDTNIHAVLFPRQTHIAVQAKSYWQHTGEVVSSRRAEVCLSNLKLPIPRFTEKYIAGMASSVVNENTTRQNGNLVQQSESDDLKYICLHPADTANASSTTDSYDNNNDNVKELIKERIAGIVGQRQETYVYFCA